MTHLKRRLVGVGVVLLLAGGSQLIPPRDDSSGAKPSLAVADRPSTDVITPEERFLFDRRVTRLVEALDLAAEQEGELRFYFEEIVKDIAGGAALADRDLRKALFGDGLLPILQGVMTVEQREIFVRKRIELGFPESAEASAGAILREGGAQ